MNERRLEALLSDWQESGQDVIVHTKSGDRVSGHVEGIVDKVVVLFGGGVFHFIDLEAICDAEPTDRE